MPVTVPVSRSPFVKTISSAAAAVAVASATAMLVIIQIPTRIARPLSVCPSSRHCGKKDPVAFKRQL
jgi:hypothetical protein